MSLVEQEVDLTSPPPSKRLCVESSTNEEAQIKTATIANGKNSTKITSDYNEKCIDEEYFESYADIEVHRTMIEDEVRTDTYHEALMQDPSFIRDKVVCDVGCGSGILSMFCAQAGAKKVYAIDASKIANQAKKVITANGFDDIITVMEGRAEDIELPEKVDVIVSEWMGYMLLYETMLPSVLHIRDKWLKPGGRLFPERAVIRVALGEANWITEYEESTYDFWVGLSPMYGLEMATLADHAVQKYKEFAHVFMLPQKDVSSSPATVCDLDLNTITAKELESIKCDFKLQAMGSRRVNCLVCWFDVMFPGDVTMSTSPHLKDTHWQNTILPLQDALVKQDTPVEGCLTISQLNKRSLDVRLKYNVDGGKEYSRRYRLDENSGELP